ncbi:MAG TPA: hypothetical protein VFI23_02870 [Rhizomicrobium sp.]|nr:hypothetical protein [Rhizomicrobium sp.]
MQTRAEIEGFVAEWVANNMRGQNAISNTPLEVDRLAAGLTGAARAQGISGGDLHRVLGDLDDYLAEQCRRLSAAPV